MVPSLPESYVFLLNIHVTRIIPTVHVETLGWS